MCRWQSRDVQAEESKSGWRHNLENPAWGKSTYCIIYCEWHHKITQDIQDTSRKALLPGGNGISYLSTNKYPTGIIYILEMGFFCFCDALCHSCAVNVFCWTWCSTRNRTGTFKTITEPAPCGSVLTAPPETALNCPADMEIASAGRGELSRQEEKLIWVRILNLSASFSPHTHQDKSSLSSPHASIQSLPPHIDVRKQLCIFCWNKVLKPWDEAIESIFQKTVQKQENNWDFQVIHSLHSLHSTNHLREFFSLTQRTEEGKYNCHMPQQLLVVQWNKREKAISSPTPQLLHPKAEHSPQR